MISGAVCLTVGLLMVFFMGAFLYASHLLHKSRLREEEWRMKYDAK